MKHKNRIFLVLGFLIVLLVCLLVLRYNSDTNFSPSTDLTNTLLSNATVTIPEFDPQESVKLTGKTTEFTLPDDESGAYSTITLIGDAVGTEETVYEVIAFNAGGSGTFYYLTAFEKTPDGYVGRGYEPLGDRIEYQYLTEVAPNTVDVSYRTHGPTQTMADKPNQEVVQTYIYSNGEFTPSEN